jgi:uncharacterized alpha-E superfamily protein
MLLSRTAQDLYWLGRNMERAEAVARLVGEHTSLLVDLPVDVESDWMALLAITGSESEFVDRYERQAEPEVVTFLLADIGNPGSVLRSVNAARESLRVSRQLVPRRAWECLNRLHLVAADELAGCAARTTRSRVTDEVVIACQQFAGIIDGTMNRDHAHCFWELGRLVERSDMTTRVLDVRACSLMNAAAPTSHPPADRSPYEDVRWLGVLRALAAQDTYHRSTGSSVAGAGVVDFLLDDADFPRSLRHCSDRIDDLLERLPERPGPSEASGSLRAVAAGRNDTLDAEGLHEHLDALQRALIGVHAAIEDAYFPSIELTVSLPGARSPEQEPTPTPEAVT